VVTPDSGRVYRSVPCSASIVNLVEIAAVRSPRPRGVEGLVVAQRAPGDARELVGQATASLFLCNRCDAELSHGPKLYRAQLCGLIRGTFAAWINSVCRYLLPRLEMRPRIDRPPVLCCRGTRPHQAAKSRRARKPRRYRSPPSSRSKSAARPREHSSTGGTWPRPG
jgi:hypothetical protein